VHVRIAYDNVAESLRERERERERVRPEIESGRRRDETWVARHIKKSIKKGREKDVKSKLGQKEKERKSTKTGSEIVRHRRLRCAREKDGDNQTSIS
jgi:hypothetical protein